MGLFDDVMEVAINTTRIVVDASAIIASPIVKPLKKGTKILSDGLKDIKDSIDDALD